MKKAALIIAVIMLCMSLASCNKNTDVPSGMKLASTNEAASYSLFVPEDWVVDIDTGATSAHVSDSDKSNVSVMAWSLPTTDSTVDDWYEIAKEELAVSFTDFTEVSVEETTMGGVYAKDFTYTAKLGSEARQYRQVGAVKDGVVYVLTYSTTPDLFDKYLEEVDSIINEFIIK